MLYEFQMYLYQLLPLEKWKIKALILGSEEPLSEMSSSTFSEKYLNVIYAHGHWTAFQSVCLKSHFDSIVKFIQIPYADYLKIVHLFSRSSSPVQGHS